MDGKEMGLWLATALVLTIVIEYGVLRLLGERSRRVLLSSVVVNVLTNVPLNVYLLTVGTGWDSLFLGELLVLAVETLWYCYFVGQWIRALIYSLFCNIVSFMTGALIQLLVLYFLNA